MTSVTEVAVCGVLILMGLTLNATILRDSDLGVVKGRSLLDLITDHVKRVHWIPPVGCFTSRSFGQFSSGLPDERCVPLSYLQVVDTTRTYVHYNMDRVIYLPLLNRTGCSLKSCLAF
jgi:hypothetical protein